MRIYDECRSQCPSQTLTTVGACSPGRMIGALGRPLDAARAGRDGAGGRGADLPPGGRSYGVTGRPAARHVRAAARPPGRGGSRRRPRLGGGAAEPTERAPPPSHQGRPVLRRRHGRLGRGRAPGARRAGLAGDVLRGHRLRRQRFAVPRRRPARSAGLGLAEMAATGFATIGSHTHTHRVLDDASATETADEIARSVGLDRGPPRLDRAGTSRTRRPSPRRRPPRSSCAGSSGRRRSRATSPTVRAHRPAPARAARRDRRRRRRLVSPQGGGRDSPRGLAARCVVMPGRRAAAPAHSA